MARKDPLGEALRSMCHEGRRERMEALVALSNNDLADRLACDAARLRCTREQEGCIRNSRQSLYDYYLERGNFRGFHGTGISKRVFAILDAYLTGRDGDISVLVEEIERVENAQLAARKALQKRADKKRAGRRSDAKRAETSVRFMHAPRRTPQGEEFEPDPIRENALRILEER